MSGVGVMGNVAGLIVSGDGYAYVVYGWREFTNPDPCFECQLDHMRLLRIDTSGGYQTITLGWGTTIEDLSVFGAGLITNADQGMAVSWTCDSPYP
jgi:hypothetical protein